MKYSSRVNKKVENLRKDLEVAYESYLGKRPSDEITDKELATEVRIYAQRNTDVKVLVKCSELLELVNQIEVDSLLDGKE